MLSTCLPHPEDRSRTNGNAPATAIAARALAAGRGLAAGRDRIAAGDSAWFLVAAIACIAVAAALTVLAARGLAPGAPLGQIITAAGLPVVVFGSAVTSLVSLIRRSSAG